MKAYSLDMKHGHYTQIAFCRSIWKPLANCDWNIARTVPQPYVRQFLGGSVTPIYVGAFGFRRQCMHKWRWLSEDRRLIESRSFRRGASHLSKSSHEWLGMLSGHPMHPMQPLDYRSSLILRSVEPFLGLPKNSRSAKHDCSAAFTNIRSIGQPQVDSAWGSPESYIQGKEPPFDQSFVRIYQWTERFLICQVVRNPAVRSSNVQLEAWRCAAVSAGNAAKWILLRLSAYAMLLINAIMILTKSLFSY